MKMMVIKSNLHIVIISRIFKKTKIDLWMFSIRKFYCFWIQIQIKWIPVFYIGNWLSLDIDQVILILVSMSLCECEWTSSECDGINLICFIDFLLALYDQVPDNCRNETHESSGENSSEVLSFSSLSNAKEIQTIRLQSKSNY